MSLKHSLNLSTFIIQAPMAGASDAEFVACASNLGVLGSLGAGMMSPETIYQQINKIKSLTNKPFAVNLMILPQEKTQKYSQAMPDWLKDFYDELALTPTLDTYPAYDFNQQFDVLLKNPVALVGFTFGILDKEAVDALHSVGTQVVGTANCIQEVLAWQTVGADAVVIQSADAGGHQGGFLNENPDKLPILSLLNLVKKEAKIPLIAAGGISHKKQIQELLDNGADMVAIGTLFLTTKESPINPIYKQKLLVSTAKDTVLTKVFSGKWARGVSNGYIQKFAKIDEQFLPEYPSLNAMTKPLRTYGLQTKNTDLLSLWAGTSVDGCRDETMAELIQRIS